MPVKGIYCHILFHQLNWRTRTRKQIYAHILLSLTLSLSLSLSLFIYLSICLSNSFSTHFLFLPLSLVHRRTFCHRITDTDIEIFFSFWRIYRMLAINLRNRNLTYLNAALTIWFCQCRFLDKLSGDFILFLFILSHFILLRDLPTNRALLWLLHME